MTYLNTQGSRSVECLSTAEQVDCFSYINQGPPKCFEPTSAGLCSSRIRRLPTFKFTLPHLSYNSNIHWDIHLHNWMQASCLFQVLHMHMYGACSTTEMVNHSYSKTGPFHKDVLPTVHIIGNLMCFGFGYQVLFAVGKHTRNVCCESRLASSCLHFLSQFCMLTTYLKSTIVLLGQTVSCHVLSTSTRIAEGSSIQRFVSQVEPYVLSSILPFQISAHSWLTRSS